MIQVMMYLIYLKKVCVKQIKISSLILFSFSEQYHLGVVVEYDNTGEKDPRAKAVGIVTFEDIIEEMIQEEIIDETDVFSKKNELVNIDNYLIFFFPK